mmetsp:Transcript_16633/g.25638  ORF Transcript_16633/g.25638 Transcript_16633/m.25638 type:complete len:204 (+) Transcript_16633:933-1544(+)
MFRLLRLQKIISFVGFDTDTRARIRIFQQIFTLIFIIHWVACYYYYITHSNYELVTALAQQHESDHEAVETVDHQFDFSYWMPQVDLNDGETEFYNNEAPIKFQKMMYFSTLLVVGNDITPQTMEEIVYCSAMLILGQFLVSMVFGGITAEMQKAQDKQKNLQKLFDYVFFSLEFHSFPAELESEIVSYVHQSVEIKEMQQGM